MGNRHPHTSPPQQQNLSQPKTIQLASQPPIFKANPQKILVREAFFQPMAVSRGEWT